MSGAKVFFIYEMRRHASVVLVAWSLWLLGFLIHLSDTGDWNFWGTPPYPGMGIYLMIWVAPFLAVFLALSGWSSERERGTLSWLYARPLSSRALFLGRVAAVLAALSTYGFGALLLNGYVPRLGEVFAFSHDLGLPASLVGGALLAAGVVALVGCGLLASAVGNRSRPASAMALVAVLALVAGEILLFRLVGAERFSRWGDAVSWTVVAVHGALFAAALLSGTWAAVRRGPLVGRWAAAARGAAPPACAALAVLAFFALDPVHFGAIRVVAVRDLGAGVRLEAVRTPWMRFTARYPFHMPLAVRIAREDRRQLLSGRLEPAEILQATAPARGVAVLPRVQNDSWYAVDRGGRTREIDFPAEVHPAWLSPVGFSPGEVRFAWSEPGEPRRLVVADEDFAVRGIEIPQEVLGPLAEVFWLDDERLWLRGWILPIDEKEAMKPVWAVVDLRGEVSAGSFDDDGDVSAFSVGSQRASLESRHGVRFAGNPVAQSADGKRLLVLDLGTRTWQMVVEINPPRTWVPFAGAGETLVFTSTADGDDGVVTDVEVVRREPGTFEPSCRFRHAAEKVEAVELDDGWAVWHEASGGGAGRFLACHLDTGATRTAEAPELVRLAAVDVVAAGVLTPRGLMRWSDLDLTADPRVLQREKDP